MAMVMEMTITTKVSSQNVTSVFATLSRFFQSRKCWQKEIFAFMRSCNRENTRFGHFTFNLVFRRRRQGNVLICKASCKPTFSFFFFFFGELHLWFCELNLSVSFCALELIAVAVLGPFLKGPGN